MVAQYWHQGGSVLEQGGERIGDGVVDEVNFTVLVDEVAQ